MVLDASGSNSTKGAIKRSLKLIRKFPRLRLVWSERVTP